MSILHMFHVIAISILYLASQSFPLVHASDTSNQYEVGKWSKTSSPADVSWFGVCVSNSGAVIGAVANPGGIYVSYNYGSSWHQSDAPEMKWRAIACSGDGNRMTALVDDESSAIFQSYDAGATWSDITATTVLGPSQRWEAIVCSDDGQYLVAVNSLDAIYVSQDFGATWAYTTISLFWFDAAVSASGEYMVVVGGENEGPGGVILSSDYGTSWARSNGISTDSNQWVSTAISSDGQTIYAVDSLVVGGVFVTYDAGDTWEMLSNGPNVTITDIVSSDDGTFLVAAYTGLYNQHWIYVSDNGGAYWNKTDEDFTNIQLASSSSGAFVVSVDYDGAVYSYTPGCAPGYEHEGFDSKGDNACVACEGGYYSTSGTCEACGAGTYSTTTGATSPNTCSDCLYPLWTTHHGANKCTALYLQLPLMIQLFIFGAIFALFLAFLGNDDPNMIPVLVILVFPLLDVFTDLAYLLSSKFYDVSIFVLLVICFFHNVPFFLYLLVKYEAYPSAIEFAWWLSSSTTAADITDGNLTAVEGDHIPYPTIYGKRFQLLFACQTHHNVYALAFELITWCAAVLCQLLWLAAVPFALIFWFILGIFLHMTKLLAVSRVWNIWFIGWTARRDLEDIGGGVVDTEDLNQGLVMQFFLETAPQLILQGVNNTLFGLWASPIAVFSFIVSIIMTLNVIYQYIYHSKLKSSPLSMKDIPLDKSLRLKIMSIDWTIMNVSLQPYTRQLRCETKGDSLSEKLLNGTSDNALLVDEENAAPKEPFAEPSALISPEVPTPSLISPPHEIICPITGLIMEDPVICEDGYTYERQALLQHLQTHGTSPVTRLKLSSHALLPNRVVLSMIHKFKAQGNS